MHLKLKKPLAFLDLETTGVNPRLDRIVEIAVVKLRPDGGRETWKRRINPQRPIPAAVTAIHGIRDADVATAPTFAEIAFDLQRFLGGCDLAGFGIIRFDVPLLAEEFRRVNVEFPPPEAKQVDVQRIYHQREPRTLSAALKFYRGRDHVGAHGAEADVLATIDVLEGQFGMYADLARDVDGLAAVGQPPKDDVIDAGGRLRWNGDEVVVNFGQKNGTSLRELAANEANYLRWMLNKDFPADVKKIVKDALEGRFPQRTPPAKPGAVQEELAL
jgi:DNA polymerase-3 subunit epsilon